MRLDEYGYYSTQIWMLTNKFGHAIRMGNKNPFNLEIIIKGGEPLHNIENDLLEYDYNVCEGEEYV